MQEPAPAQAPARDLRFVVFHSPGPQCKVQQFAAEDPAVKSGLLKHDVRVWLIGMSQASS